MEGADSSLELATLRAAELGVSARIDPYTWAYGVVEFTEEDAS